MLYSLQIDAPVYNFPKQYPECPEYAEKCWMSKIGYDHLAEPLCKTSVAAQRSLWHMLSSHRQITLSTCILQRRFKSCTTVTDAFKRAFQEIAQPVAVITGHGREIGARGITVSSLTSLSVNPPRVMFNIKRPSKALCAVGKDFVAHMLHYQDDHISIATRLAQNEQHNTDEWHEDDSSWSVNNKGIPILQNTTKIHCATEHMFEVSDHCIVVGRVINVELAEENGTGLVYRQHHFSGSS